MYIYIYHHYNTHSNKIKQKWRKIGTFLRFKGCYDQLKKVFSTYYPTLGIGRNRPDHPVTSGSITITEGRKRQIRRMMKAVRCCVVALKRISIDNIVLDENLKPGEWKEFSP